MIKIGHVRDPKWYYENYPKTGIITAEFEESGIKVCKELTIPEAIAVRDELTDMIEWIAGQTVNDEVAEELKNKYKSTPVEGSSSERWNNKATDAYQDGMITVLDAIGLKVKGINS